MNSVLVDSNILLDISTDDPDWAPWSNEALQNAGLQARLVINPIIYAELSVGHSRIETLDALLPANIFQREALPWSAAFLAGKVSMSVQN